MQVLFTITYNYRENQKYSVLPYVTGFNIPTWRFHWFNKWVQSISLIHQSNFNHSQWKTYSCCHQWIDTARQWLFTDSGLENTSGSWSAFYSPILDKKIHFGPPSRKKIVCNPRKTFILLVWLLFPLYSSIKLHIRKIKFFFP